MSVRLLTVVVATALATMHVAIAENLNHPDKKVGSKEVTGRLIRYQEGDYVHVTVKPEQGNEQSFFVDDEICFLAANREDMLVIEYDQIERFFPEGNAYFPANVIRTIATRSGSKRWIRSASSKPTAAEQNECALVLRTKLIKLDGK